MVISSPRNEDSRSLYHESHELSTLKPVLSETQIREESSRKKARARTAVDYKKQLGRDDFPKSTHTAHEKRFEMTGDIPRVSSKHRRVMSPRIKDYLPRDSATFATSLSLSQYSPKYDVVYPKTIREVNFNKYLGRKDKRREFTNLEYNSVNHSAIKPDKSIPDFSKSTARPSLKFLPSFMHSTCSRLAIQQLNHKTLEMNNFADGDMYGIYSSFQSPKSSVVKALTSPKHRYFKFE